MKWQTIEREVRRIGAEKWVEGQIARASQKKETKANVRRARELREIVQAAAPTCPVEVASEIAVDLADLERVGAKHRRHVNKILKLVEPREASQVADILVEVEVNLLFEGLFHLSSLRKNLPKLKSALKKASRENSL